MLELQAFDPETFHFHRQQLAQEHIIFVLELLPAIDILSVHDLLSGKLAFIIIFIFYAIPVVYDHL